MTTKTTKTTKTTTTRTTTTIFGTFTKDHLADLSRLIGLVLIPPFPGDKLPPNLPAPHKRGCKKGDL